MAIAPGVRVGLLDGFTLRLSGGDAGAAADLPRGVQRLVAHVCHTGRPARAAIAGRLWPDVTDAHAHGSLRSALWRVQRDVPGLLDLSGGALSLAAGVQVDVRELTDWARRAMDPAAPPEGRPGNVDLDGELLPGWYDDWVLLEREWLRQLRVHAFEAVAGKLSAAARYGEAVVAAYAALRADPLRESAHRTVVRIHLAEGNLVEAVRAYQACRDLFADQLGVAPTPEMSGLVRGLPGCVVVGAPLLACRTAIASPERPGRVLTAAPERHGSPESA